MSADFYLKLIDLIHNYWHKKTTLLVVCIVVIIIIGAIFHFNVLNWFCWQQYLIIAVATIIIILTWFFTNRPQKISKNKVGVIIAITTEDEEDARIFESDFIRPIEERASRHDIIVLQLSYEKSKDIRNKDNAHEICAKLNGNMIIWGQFKKRKIDSKEQRVIESHALLLHNKISTELSHKLGQSMSDMLPLSVYFEKEHEYKTLSLLTMNMEYAVSYFLSISLCLSNRIDEGVQILNKLRDALEQSQIKLWHQEDFLKAVNIQLTGSYLKLTHKEYTKWKHDKDPSHLIKMDDYLTEIKNHKLIVDDYYILKAILLFVSRHDAVDESLQELNNASQKDNACIMFNLAFLYAYKGMLQQALKYYQKIKNTDQKIPPELLHRIVHEIISFIEDIISEEPSNNSLNFALGIVINSFTDNKDMAKKYLNLFINNADLEKNKRQIEYVQKLLSPPLVKISSKKQKHSKK